MDKIDPTRHFFEDERTSVFIDGANLYAASRALSFEVDYSQLLEFFTERTSLVHAYYFSAIMETDDYSPLKPLTDWLAYNGYNMVTKPAKEYFDTQGRRRVKGNMDIEIAVEMLEQAAHVQHMVLFSGDADFQPLVKAVQRKGVKVTVVSTKDSQPPMIGDELRRQANRFIELNELKEHFTRRHDETAVANQNRSRQRQRPEPVELN